MITLLYLLAGVLFILGLRGLGSPRTARRGNQIAAVGMLLGEWLRQNLAPTSPEAGLGPTGSGR